MSYATVSLESPCTTQDLLLSSQVRYTHQYLTKSLGYLPWLSGTAGKPSRWRSLSLIDINSWKIQTNTNTFHPEDSAWKYVFLLGCFWEVVFLFSITNGNVVLSTRLAQDHEQGYFKNLFLTWSSNDWPHICSNAIAVSSFGEYGQ